MNHNKLAQKRTRKALKRKNKKYAGPKYSKLEQIVLWAPILERAGIQLFEQPEGVRQHVESKDTNTSFV
jgi:hypothetical protein